MAKDDSDRQMTIPELLEARAVIRHRLEMGTDGSRKGYSEGNYATRDKLLVELQEIEAELAEQGHVDAASAAGPT